jgi:hypothetical protein
MTPEETGKLLATCASFDRRKAGPLDVIAWHRVLGDLSYADCENAVIAHYTEGAEWIMPAHVRQRVRDIRDKRIADADVPAPPPELVDNPVAYEAALHAARVAIADGRDPHAAMAAIARKVRRELESS